MEFEDSRMALFPEPNAYIQKCNKDICEPKKVVFQEPYESMPAFYINNNFKKGNCDCIPKPKKQEPCHNKCACDTKQGNKSSGFDLKNVLPLLGMLNKGGGADLSSLVGMLNNNSQTNNNPMNFISSLMSNKDMMSGILNMFKGGGFNLFNKKQENKKRLLTLKTEKIAAVLVKLPKSCPNLRAQPLQITQNKVKPIVLYGS